MSARVGLLVNPAAGRDVRRLTGGASVSSTYAKRRVAECVVAGVSLATDRVEVLVAPDTAEIGQHAVAEADRAGVDLLDMPVEGTAADTRRATARFRTDVDAVVCLGGDGTTADVAAEVGDVPVLSVSTGTNNVVPTAVDGTVAGAAVALVATGAVDAEAVTTRHTMVEARADDGRSLRGLAALGVVDRAFVGTRAVLNAEDFLGGIVSRASRGAIGLPGVAGSLTRLAADVGHGVAFELDAEASRRVTTITVPGVVDSLGVAEWTVLDARADESYVLSVEEAVVSADGERELELQDAELTLRPVCDGPRLIDVETVFDEAPLAEWVDDAEA